MESNFSGEHIARFDDERQAKHIVYRKQKFEQTTSRGSYSKFNKRYYGQKNTYDRDNRFTVKEKWSYKNRNDTYNDPKAILIRRTKTITSRIHTRTKSNTMSPKAIRSACSNNINELHVIEQQPDQENIEHIIPMLGIDKVMEKPDKIVIKLIESKGLNNKYIPMFKENFYVVPNLTHNFILSRSALRGLGYALRLEREKFEHVQSDKILEGQDLLIVNQQMIMMQTFATMWIWAIIQSTSVESSANIDNNIEPQIKNLLQQLISKNQRLESKNSFDIGQIPNAEMKSELKPGTKPIKHKQVKELENIGIIRKSCSQFAATVLLVKKKGVSLRMCVDYRKLNQATILDEWPLPNINDIMYDRDICMYQFEKMTGTKLHSLSQTDYMNGIEWDLVSDLENSPSNFLHLDYPVSSTFFKNLLNSAGISGKTQASESGVSNNTLASKIVETERRQEGLVVKQKLKYKYPDNTKVQLVAKKLVEKRLVENSVDEMQPFVIQEKTDQLDSSLDKEQLVKTINKLDQTLEQRKKYIAKNIQKENQQPYRSLKRGDGKNIILETKGKDCNMKTKFFD
ncbi:RETRotransposon-like family member [Reticulomyxa filosa]|uniref:RETRotransposon-like family member n=1 Tax=Reticulomyxa filosa TaxID=46433 RepID=X6P2X6_RETFI|nr:RETRotransposon-like family member [Reticulomyxa filosa]|eukprot:ETO32488.1 RETRotransposon-like family member [Reticulomyxa filosa]